MNDINIPEMLRCREALLEDFMHKNHPGALRNIYSGYSSVSEFLHAMGVQNGLYRGNYNPNQLSAMNNLSQNRYVDSDSITAERIHRIRGNYSFGEFCMETNAFRDPSLNISHGLKIKKGKEFVYTNPVKTIKSNHIIYGDEYLENIGLSADERENVNFQRKREPYLAEVSLENLIFNGNAGSAIIGSAGAINETQYSLGVMQPLIYNNGIVFESNINFWCGCRGKSLGSNPQEEFERQIESDKHVNAYLVGLRKGKIFLENHNHEVRSIQRPIGRNVDNLPVITLFQGLEDLALPNGETNIIATDLGALINKRYYIDNLPMRQVDYEVLNKYWDLIVSPSILVSMVLNQKDYLTRQKETCIKGGNVYMVTIGNPEITYFVNEIRAPFPSAKVADKVDHLESGISVSLSPLRELYLRECSACHAWNHPLKKCHQ